jgi:hypothetical protein
MRQPTTAPTSGPAFSIIGLVDYRHTPGGARQVSADWRASNAVIAYTLLSSLAAR